MTTGRELARAIRTAYLALHRRTDGCFAADEVTADQFVLLSALADGEAATQQELVRRIGSDPNTVRAMLVLLESRGLVARNRHPEDGRARRAGLTAKGRRTFARLWTKSEPVRQKLLSALRPDEVVTLAALLRRVGDAMAPEEFHRPTTTSKGALPCGD
ncbi:MAG TPA: MarR family transcriptional regulator [Planctomycetia bacterium]|nr:MarR family transcriptional regulator [Planctomycetia bacterium]